MFNTPEEVFYSVIAGVLLMLFLSVVFVLSIVRYQRRVQKHFYEKEKLKTQFSKVLFQSQLEIKDQTLKEIGYELHDNLGQISSIIKINLNTIQLADQTKAAQKIEDTKDLVRQLITDIKSLSLSLNSDRIAHLGLQEGINLEVEKIKKLGQFEISFKQNGPDPELKPNTIVIVYRMIQEFMNNIIKHSKAKHIDISLQVEEKMVILEFRDDGIGFNVDEKLNSGGSGLLNLSNRAKLLNAGLFIKSSHDKGTVYTLQLPT